jgi:LPS export ABC transporter protein LptC
VFAGLAVLAIFKIGLPKKQVIAKKENQKNSPSPEMIIKGFSIQENLKNKDEVLILNSEEGRVFRKSNQIECINLSCNLHRKENEIAQLKSKNALVDRDKKIVFLQGKVLGYFYELNIEGNDMNYDFSNQIIKTEQPINYIHPNLNLIAKQSTFDIKESQIEMNGGVKCKILNQEQSK